MLALDFIRAHPDRVRQAIRQKGVELDLDEMLQLAADVRAGRGKLDDLRAERNRLSSSFRDASDPERTALRDRMAELRGEIRQLEEAAARSNARLNELLLWIPNLPWEGAPEGLDASANVVLRHEGRPPTFEFEPKDHVTLLEQNDWADLARVSKVCGNRTYGLKGPVALLEQVLWLHAAKRLIADGFQFLGVPSLAAKRAFINTGHFPFGEEDAFETPRDRLYLAGTAEIVLNSLHGGEILTEADLPLLYAGFSPCFRREAGSGGRDVRGLLRVHQFYKVEQFVICRDDPEESALWHARLLANAEAILADLELPYQVVECSVGDMGIGKVRMNDIETWVPSLRTYRETHSCSTLHDWQARRANIRYRCMEGKVSFVHTLNNTAIATPRILVPLLENHQTSDGRVRLPKALRPYFGGDRHL
jgi:seryl-tRNA synthetase